MQGACASTWKWRKNTRKITVIWTRITELYYTIPKLRHISILSAIEKRHMDIFKIFKSSIQSIQNPAISQVYLHLYAYYWILALSQVYIYTFIHNTQFL